MIDFRSDTVTRPTRGMLEAMINAPVGDDVFGEDPSINQLESAAAGMFGMEAALYCPSGTMSNQIAIKCHTRPGDEVICASNAHVYIYEGGGIAANAGSQVRALEGDQGRITATQVSGAINPDDVHKARTSLVCLENTSNRGGGSCYDFQTMDWPCTWMAPGFLMPWCTRGKAPPNTEKYFTAYRSASIRDWAAPWGVY